jgi:hypothetical protein
MISAENSDEESEEVDSEEEKKKAKSVRTKGNGLDTAASTLLYLAL